MKLNFIEERLLFNLFMQPRPQGYLSSSRQERERGDEAAFQGGKLTLSTQLIRPFFFAFQLTKKQNPRDVSSVWAIFFVFGFFFILKTSTVHKLTLLALHNFFQPQCLRVCSFYKIIYFCSRVYHGRRSYQVLLKFSERSP